MAQAASAVDVMLVLLIMFVITVPMMTHAIKLDMRQAHPPQRPLVPPQMVEWAVNAQPEIHLRPDSRAKCGDVAAVLASQGLLAKRHWRENLINFWR